MLKFLNKLYLKISLFLDNKKFIWFIAVLFSFESLWIALSNTYPLPFDEYYHFGLIDLYSHRWLPFISNQPDYAAVYGDITRNGSYIYHYFMSFPYRLVGIFTDSFVAKVIIFRLFNIAFFVIGLFLFRKLLAKLGLSLRLTHFVLVCFILVPIVPLLAAQSNYDNLLIILLPTVLLLAVDIIKQKEINAKTIILLLSLSMLTCLVKHTFLPIFLILFGYIFYVLIRRNGGGFFSKFLTSFNTQNRNSKIILAFLLLVCLFLFGERYLLNTIKYHNPQPDCLKVQEFDVCSQWSPWIRNYRYIDRYKDVQTEGPVGFSKIWVPKMINDAFIAFTYVRVDPVGIRSELGDVKTKEALSIPKATAKIIFAIGIILILMNFGRLWNDSRWRMIFMITIFYTVTLWLLNYMQYRQLRHIVAIQPRYMIILAPLIMGAIAKAYYVAIKSRKVRATLATVVLLALLQGGGASIYIIRSYSVWYWPNKTVVWVNSRARDVLYKITIVR